MKWAAAFLACSLCWLAAPLEAAVKKPAQAAPAAKTTKKNSAARKSSKSLADAVFVAEVDDDEDFGLRGRASFYGNSFHGRRTSTGERFDLRQFTAASNRFPLGTQVAVQRLDNARCAIVKINDRMHSKHQKRVIDVSRSVAEYLEMIRAGVVLVRVARIKPGDKGNQACVAAFEVNEENCPTCTGRVESQSGMGMGMGGW